MRSSSYSVNWFQLFRRGSVLTAVVKQMTRFSRSAVHVVRRQLIVIGEPLQQSSMIVRANTAFTSYCLVMCRILNFTIGVTLNCQHCLVIVNSRQVSTIFTEWSNFFDKITETAEKQLGAPTRYFIWLLVDFCADSDAVQENTEYQRNIWHISHCSQITDLLLCHSHHLNVYMLLQTATVFSCYILGIPCTCLLNIYLPVYYCSTCQMNDWSRHKSFCFKETTFIGSPFIISIAESQSMYSNLCRAAEAYAR